jgi:hypothetical protein
MSTCAGGDQASGQASESGLAAELKGAVGKRVELLLVPWSPSGPARVTGKILGVLDAADGLVVTIELDDAAGARETYHYHYIAAVTPAS